jgi:hypothetical protein
MDEQFDGTIEEISHGDSTVNDMTHRQRDAILRWKWDLER